MKLAVVAALTALTAVAASVAMTGSTLAETAEQTVAYAFYGLADDASLTRGKTHLEWHEVSSSPAVFTGHGEGGMRPYDVTFTVTATGDCDFEVELAGPSNMIRGGKTLYARISLNEIVGITGEALQVRIEGDGYCQTGALNSNCTRVHATDIYGSLDPVKHALLVERLHSEICVGE